MQGGELSIFEDLTRDEVFVTYYAAEDGVRIKKKSKTENLVLLKHFGPGHPSAPKEINPDHFVTFALPGYPYSFF